MVMELRHTQHFCFAVTSVSSPYWDLLTFDLPGCCFLLELEMEPPALLGFSGILVVAVGTEFGFMKQKILFSDWCQAGMVFPMTRSTVEGDGGGGGHCTPSSFPQSFLAP